MENYIVEGNISVKAVLLANRRKVERIYVDPKKKDRDTSFILRKAKEMFVPIQTLPREKIDALALGKTHGGILAVCSERKYQNLEDVVNKTDVFLALIEGVEDPFNFGYILRTLYAAGCDGVIIPPRNWTNAADVVTKSSAGASEYINLFIAENMENTLQLLKKHQISIVCGQRNDAISLYDFSFPKKVCIAIGGEMRGLSKQVQSQSSQNLFIPYHAEFKNALTAASSSAIFAFEILRQKEANAKKLDK